MSNENLTVYEQLQKVVPTEEMGNHESDLYVPVTDETTKIISTYEYAENVSTFKDNISGRLYYDVPFAYYPYWEELFEKRA